MTVLSRNALAVTRERTFVLHVLIVAIAMCSNHLAVVWANLPDILQLSCRAVVDYTLLSSICVCLSNV